MVPIWPQCVLINGEYIPEYIRAPARSVTDPDATFIWVVVLLVLDIFWALTALVMIPGDTFRPCVRAAGLRSLAMLRLLTPPRVCDGYPRSSCQQPDPRSRGRKEEEAADHALGGRHWHHPGLRPGRHHRLHHRHRRAPRKVKRIDRIRRRW